MPLARLENFLKNLNGNILYVDPNELDATDSIDNRGNSKLRPFKTIQRALLEAARFAYVSGSNNDLFDQTTILISPGTHYIDNRPGYYVDASANIKDINNGSKVINEFNILSNFDITDPENELYIYNSVDGGVILPKGTSIVSTDLRKTKIRPKFVPDPASSTINRTSIFRLTGSCYIFGFTIFDGDPLGKVYNTYSTNTVNASFSHHKLTAFEYADGVNKVIRNGSNTNHTDLEMYYYKISLAYGIQSSRSVIDGYDNLQPNIDEYRIVGDLGSGEIPITSVVSGDGINGTNVITVTTESNHNLTALTPIIISGVGQAEGSTTQLEYNGNFIVAQIISPTQFSYLLSTTPTQTLSPSISGSIVKIISDTTTSSSPYVFNCSLKSVYGMNGLHADGSKATGFRSMVTAQFTGISLQKDDRAFVQYNPSSGAYNYQANLGVTEFLHQQSTAIYRPDWQTFHIKASNNAFIQCVSIFAIGYANQFVASDGGDQSITNSNSNFGERALFSEGFKDQTFAKDNHGFITHIVLPKDVSLDKKNINFYNVNVGLTTTLASSNLNTRVYLSGYIDVLTPPLSKSRGYAIGGANEDKIYYSNGGQEFYADINPRYKISLNISSINLSTNELTLPNIVGISTGLPIKIIAKNAIIPDGIENYQTYFAKPTSNTTIRIYENLSNSQTDTTGALSVKILNSVGVTVNNLYLVSKISDIDSGTVGSPIQWDSTNKNWYIGITINQGSPNFISGLTSSGSSPILYIKRNLDTRSTDDRSFKVRLVIPKESRNASDPTSGFVFEKSTTPLSQLYPESNSTELVSPVGDELSLVRNKNAIIDAWYTSGTVTIVTKNSHNLRVGNKISIFNLKSSNEPNPTGIGTGTGFNGYFVVASIVDDITFTYAISINPGTITAGISATQNWLTVRDCTQSSSFRVAPYTIFNTSRSNLPYFTCNQIENHYQIYKINTIQKYVQDSSDGIYQITLDAYKNTPTTSPFNTSDIKYGQNLNYFYPTIDADNLNTDPDPTVSLASRKIIGKVEVSDPSLNSTKEVISEFMKDFGLSNRIIQFTKSGNNCVITTERNHGLGGIRRVIVDTAGTGYTNGTYFDIPLCGGTGKNATINVTVTGNVATDFEIANPGSGYSISDSLSIKGIPGSTNPTSVTIPSNLGLFFQSNDSDSIQIIGATNSQNNGTFIISSVTTNTVTFENVNCINETQSNAILILSGIGYPIGSVPDGSVYDPVTQVTTITTQPNNPHSLSIGNKVIFDNPSQIFTVSSIIGINTFTVSGDASASTKVYSVGFTPTLKDSNATNENLNVRNYTVYSKYKSRIGQIVGKNDLSFTVNNIQGLQKGDFVQVENEIMMITRIGGSSVRVKRSLFGTQSDVYANNTSIKRIDILPVELRRPSVLRASGQTFEYTGFGPGNYSTAMPSNQDRVLSSDEVLISQSLSSRSGLVVYTGMNSNGEFFIGRKKYDAVTGTESYTVNPETNNTNNSGSLTIPDPLTVNKLIVNDEIDASTAKSNFLNLNVTGVSTFVGITTFTAGISVAGVSTFNGITTFTAGISVAGVSTFAGITTFTAGISVAGVSTFNGNTFVSAGSSFIGNGTIPVGGIIMWSGTIAAAQALTGWTLCNGNNGVPINGLTIPDLRDRFIVGAGSGYAVAATGGSKDAVLVSHSHSVTPTGSGNARFVIDDDQGNAEISIAGGGRSANLQRTVSTNSQGESGTNKNLPPYYALAFIMRTA